MTTTLLKTDGQIKTDVLEELKWDPTIDESDIGVRVKDGIVMLTGSIDAYPKKLAARDAAHRVHGVLDVVDELQVNIPSHWEKTDEDLAKAVRHAMKWDVLVPDDRITSTVSKGVVTLQGKVDTWAQRFDTAVSVQRLAGVKGLVNQITVSAKTVNPMQIKRDIEEALERQTEREIKRLGIAVRDGVVTLTGTLRSWSEKNAAERVAANAPGVCRVEDKTVVDPYC